MKDAAHNSKTLKENTGRPDSEWTRRTISSQTSQQIRTAHESSIGSREIPRNAGDSARTILTRAIQYAKGLEKRDDAMIVTPVEVNPFRI